MPSRPLACAPALLLLGAALSSLSSLSSCSAVTNIPQESCSDNKQCREGFGLGSVCNADSGLCEEAKASPLCEDAFPSDVLTDKEKYADAVIFATLLDGVGDIQMIRSANLAIDQVAQKALDGRPYVMINCSYGDDSNVERQINDARTAARYVVDTYGALAIIGPGTSSIAEAVYNEVKDEVLIISPSATSDTLTFIDGTMKSFDNPGLFWRTAPPDSGIAARMADELIASNRQKVAVIYKDGAYGSNLADLLDKKLGGVLPNPVVREVYSDSVGSSFSAAITKVGADLSVDEIVFIADSNSDVVAFLNIAATQAQGASSFANATLMLGDAGFSEANVLSMLNPSVTTTFIDTGRIRGVKSRSPTGNVFNAFSIDYSLLYDGESPANNGYTAESYDAAWLAIISSVWAYYVEGDLKPRAMAKGLHRISAGKELEFGASSNEILSSLEAGESVNVVGASGNLDYDEETEETAGYGELWIIVDTGGTLSYMILG